MMWFFIFLSLGFTHAGERASALRQAVDTYNSLGSSGRLFAFMKLGASPTDVARLSLRGGVANNSALPQAFLAGASVYVRGLSAPLRVLDLRRGVFTYKNRKVDLSSNRSLETLMSALEAPTRTQSATLLLINWIFPEAWAGNEDEPLAAPAILALAGLARAHQCFNDQHKGCSKRFMGVLAALAQAGGATPREPPVSAFCMPDDRGRPRFVVVSERRTLFAITQSQNDFWVERARSREIAESVSAAEELLANCRSPKEVEKLNIALAYSAAANAAKSGVSVVPPAQAWRGVVEPSRRQLETEAAAEEPSAEDHGTASAR